MVTPGSIPGACNPFLGGLASPPYGSLSVALQQFVVAVGIALSHNSAVTDKANDLRDPLIERTDRAPLQAGGASFRTHRLVQVRPGRLAFRATRGAKAFAGIFVAIGLVTLAGLVCSVARQPWATVALLALAGPGFIAAGVYLFLRFGKTVVFDLTRGRAWRGGLSRVLPRGRPHALPSEAFSPFIASATKGAKEGAHSVSLDDIHALQIVADDFESEDPEGRKRSYRSYELNLVLHDASRIPVIDHGRHDRLLADARTLAAFLHVPVWDASCTPMQIIPAPPGE